MPNQFNEPWYTVTFGGGRTTIYNHIDTRIALIENPYFMFNEDQVIAERIAACVNACAGMPYKALDWTDFRNVIGVLAAHFENLLDTNPISDFTEMEYDAYRWVCLVEGVEPLPRPDIEDDDVHSSEMTPAGEELTKLRALETDIHELMVLLEDDGMILGGELLQAVANALNPHIDSERLDALREKHKRQHAERSSDDQD